MLSGAAGFFSDDAAEKKTFSNPQKKEDAGKRKRIHSNSYGGSSVGSSSKNEAWGHERGGKYSNNSRLLREYLVRALAFRNESISERISATFIISPLRNALLILTS